MQLQGNHECLRSIYEKYLPKLQAYAEQLIRRRHEAEDIVNKVFLQLLELRNRFNNLDRKTLSYLYTSVHNACIAFLREAEMHQACHEEVAYLNDGESDVELDEDVFGKRMRHLHDAVEALPSQQKKIIKLIYNEGRNADEIAKQLHLALPTVWNHKFNALAKMRRFLDGDILAYKNDIITSYSENKTDFSIAPPKIITDIRVINNNLLEIVRKNPGIMHNMQSWEFEMLVGQLFESKGYHVTLTQKTRDGGKDLIVAENSLAGSFLYYVECKRNAPHRCVSVNVIRELHGTVISEKATAGIVVTSSYFSDPAKDFTQTIRHQMSLIDYANLCKLIKNL